MVAKRMNKSYPVNTPQEKKAYLERGYDIYDDAGNIVEHSPAKTVPYSDYIELKKKYDALVEEHEALLAAQSTDETTPGTNPEDPENPDKTLKPPKDNAPKMGAGQNDKKADQK
jgi:hypothetical protein